MEIYEARDILESNGYLVERTQLEARTKDRFEIPKLSKVNDAKKEREYAMVKLFGSHSMDDAVIDSFKMLFSNVLPMSDIYYIRFIRDKDINEISFKLPYRVFAKNINYLEYENKEIYNRMLDKIKNISPIENENITVTYEEVNFIINIRFKQIKNIDVTSFRADYIPEAVSEIRETKENLKNSLNVAETKVNNIIKAFNNSYIKAWKK